MLDCLVHRQRDVIVGNIVVSEEDDGGAGQPPTEGVHVGSVGQDPGARAIVDCVNLHTKRNQDSKKDQQERKKEGRNSFHIGCVFNALAHNAQQIQLVLSRIKPINLEDVLCTLLQMISFGRGGNLR